MKFKVYLYTAIRGLLGVFLTLHAIYNVLIYTDFLVEIEMYFKTSELFNYDFIEALAPLVPFEEFILGMFLILGVFTKEVLICSLFLFAFISIFLLDANFPVLSALHMFFFMVTLLLLKKHNYNLKSMDYSRDLYKTILF
ncbi:MauE/DoxX family redox-associated membrane protein [Aquimarina litoralis]|uniref:MauE/DoxX family redox-associated membrane protein n=1 Tax=Aquimarina litoralis TaxID=584605 RepID=UPI001C5615FC|nr:MauE/DoxX family redox-associated membrane protein [Aquimarina litoralis]MBW1298807.1 hypothetical protein [Aquimarina litoralis]